MVEDKMLQVIEAIAEHEDNNAPFYNDLVLIDQVEDECLLKAQTFRRYLEEACKLLFVSREGIRVRLTSLGAHIYETKELIGFQKIK